MDHSAEHIREISSTLYKYHLDNFLCDVFIVLPDGTEVPAHSVVLSAVSVKLRAAFEKSDNGAKKNFVFRLHVSDCDVATVEVVLQFVYTGAIVLPHDTPIDITQILSAGQKLGLDASKLAACLGAILCLTDASVMENLPPVILTDEDICLEVVEKGESAAATSAKCSGRHAARTSAFIRITSRENLKRPDVGSRLDHCYTYQKSVSVTPAPQTKSCSPHISADKTALYINEQPLFVLPLDDVSLSDGSEREVDCNAHPLTGEDLPDSLSGGSPMAVAAGIRISDNMITNSGGVEGSGQHFLSALSTTDDDHPFKDVAKCVETLGGGKGEARKPVMSVAGRERVIHICDHCGKSFLRGKEYAEHRRTHTGDRPFHCDVCGRGFSRHRSVTEHRRQHTGERRFVCDVCAKQFFTSGELLKHRRYHSGEKRYHCTTCGQRFLRCGEYTDHCRVHAGQNVCLVCGKSFTRLHNMKEHMSSAHAGAKQYGCSVCGKKFAYSSGLRYHRRLHKAERPYKCQECEKCFARMGELNRHRRGTHKIFNLPALS